MEEVRGAYNILVGRPEGRNHWEDLGVDGRTTLRLILGEIGFGDVDCIYLAQDRDAWQALVNTVINLWVP
jgi:hypothetical protein